MDLAFEIDNADELPKVDDSYYLERIYLSYGYRSFNMVIFKNDKITAISVLELASGMIW